MSTSKHRIRSYMSLEYNFTGIRIREAGLIPVDWHLTVNLVAPGRKGKSREEIEKKATLTYQKLIFWLDTNLHSIIMVDVNNEDDLYIANLSSNIMMYCPGDPHDDTIVQLLHSKLSVLSEGYLLVGEMQIKGSDMAIQYSYDCPDGDYNLPALTSDYYKEGVARDVEPWWLRNDGFCFEFIRPADSEITDEELFKDIIDPLDEFERISSEVIAGGIEIVREPAGIVKVERWTPKKI